MPVTIMKAGGGSEKGKKAEFGANIKKEMERLADVIGDAEKAIKDHAADPVYRDNLVLAVENKKTVREMVSDVLSTDEKVEFAGERFTMTIGAKGKKRDITNIRKVHELLGDDVFYELCTVSLSAIDDYLTPKQREQVLKVEYTGTRNISVK